MLAAITEVAEQPEVNVSQINARELLGVLGPVDVVDNRVEPVWAGAGSAKQFRRSVRKKINTWLKDQQSTLDGA